MAKVHYYENSKYMRSQRVRRLRNASEGALFYRDLMDAMHCLLVHQYDVGLRIKVVSVEGWSQEAENAIKQHEDPQYRFINKVCSGRLDVYVFCTSFCTTR